MRVDAFGRLKCPVFLCGRCEPCPPAGIFGASRRGPNGGRPSSPGLGVSVDLTPARSFAGFAGFADQDDEEVEAVTGGADRAVRRGAEDVAEGGEDLQEDGRREPVQPRREARARWEMSWCIRRDRVVGRRAIPGLWFCSRSSSACRDSRCSARRVTSSR